MEIHNPPKLKLPPLMVEKYKDREEMEKRKDISNFIRSNLLLNLDFYNLFLDIKDKSEEIENFMKTRNYIEINKGESHFRFPMPNNVYDQADVDSVFNIVRKTAAKSAFKTLDKNSFTEFVRNYYQEENFLRNEQISSLSEGIQNSLSEFETNHDIDLEILTTESIYICINCHGILSKNKFRKTLCICGIEINTISQTYQKSIAYFGKELRKFIINNYWFEWGVEYLFRKLNFNTLCGYNVLGHSGNIHEIDVIAESNSSNLRIFCECKTGSVNTNDIFVFSGKMLDAGCSRGFMFSLSEKATKEIAYLARSKNISLIMNVLNMTESELIEDIVNTYDI